VSAQGVAPQMATRFSSSSEIDCVLEYGVPAKGSYRSKAVAAVAGARQPGARIACLSSRPRRRSPQFSLAVRRPQSQSKRVNQLRNNGGATNEIWEDAIRLPRGESSRSST